MAQAHSVKVGDLEIANDKPLTIIAGPCQMESRQHARTCHHGVACHHAMASCRDMLSCL